jgi:hypothetical protein
VLADAYGGYNGVVAGNAITVLSKIIASPVRRHCRERL